MDSREIAKLIAEDKQYKARDVERILKEKHEEDILDAIVQGLRAAIKTKPDPQSTDY